MDPTMFGLAMIILVCVNIIGIACLIKYKGQYLGIIVS